MRIERIHSKESEGTLATVTAHLQSRAPKEPLLVLSGT
jgi:hypothetical protein